MELKNLNDLLADQLKDLYSAEKQLVKALPRMAKAAESDELRSAIEKHLEETKGQVERLDQIAKLMNASLGGKKCAAMEGLVEEGKEIMEEDAEPSVLDAGLIAAAQKVEHYEMASYGTARTWASELGLDEVAQLLQETLDQERAANDKLTQIAEGGVNQSAERGDGEENGSEKSARRGNRRGTVSRA